MIDGMLEDAFMPAFLSAPPPLAFRREDLREFKRLRNPLVFAMLELVSERSSGYALIAEPDLLDVKKRGRTASIDALMREVPRPPEAVTSSRIGPDPLRGVRLNDSRRRSMEVLRVRREGSACMSLIEGKRGSGNTGRLESSDWRTRGCGGA